MRLPKAITILTLVAQLTPGAQANYEKNKALQVNYYSDTRCSSYSGEEAYWYSPKQHYVGIDRSWDDGPSADGTCWDFHEGSNTKSLNIANCWEINGHSHDSCHCDFYSGTGCGGANVRQAFYGFDCIPGRSEGGYQWKSAKCWIDY